MHGALYDVCLLLLLATQEDWIHQPSSKRRQSLTKRKRKAFQRKGCFWVSHEYFHFIHQCFITRGLGIESMDLGFSDPRQHCGGGVASASQILWRQLQRSSPSYKILHNPTLFCHCCGWTIDFSQYLGERNLKSKTICRTLRSPLPRTMAMTWGGEAWKILTGIATQPFCNIPNWNQPLSVLVSWYLGFEALRWWLSDSVLHLQHDGAELVLN